MELPPFNFEDFNKWAQGTSVVCTKDMPEEILSEAKDFVSTGIEKAISSDGINLETACKYVKEQMDRQFGPAWHCVMGEGFSFEVTRQANTTLHMYYGGKYSILLFKC